MCSGIGSGSASGEGRAASLTSGTSGGMVSFLGISRRRGRRGFMGSSGADAVAGRTINRPLPIWEATGELVARNQPTRWRFRDTETNIEYRDDVTKHGINVIDRKSVV